MEWAEDFMYSYDMNNVNEDLSILWDMIKQNKDMELPEEQLYESINQIPAE